MTLTLKRKIKLDTNVCCVSGCNRKKGLKFLLTIHRGNQEYPPYCPEHAEEKVKDGPNISPPEEPIDAEVVDDMPEELPEDSAEETTDISPRGHAEAEASEALAALSEVDAIVVEDQDDFEFVTGLAQDAKDRNKKLEEMKQSALRPLREAEKNIRGWFAPAQDAYGKLEKLLKGKLAGYVRDQEVKRLAALKEAEEAAQSGTVEEVTTALAKVSETQAPTASGVRVSKVWTFRIINESLVPDEFWDINESKIRKAVHQGIHEIPGVDVFQEEQIGIRSK